MDTVDGQVLSATPKLSDVNDNLLKKLNEIISDASTAEEILSCTEAVAKLNTSFRNNSAIPLPDSEEERYNNARSATVAEVLNGE